MRSGRLARTPQGRVAAAGLVAASVVVLVGVGFGLGGLVAAAVEHLPSVPWPRLLQGLVETAAWTGGAVLLAGPLGVGHAVWVRWLAPTPLRSPVRLVTGLLGDLPPLLWALAVWVAAPEVLATPVGVAALGLLAAPTVAGRALVVLDRVPQGDVLQAVAAGATPAQAVARVGLPATAPGLVRAVVAGAARASGDLVVLLLAAGGTRAVGLPPLLVLHPTPDDDPTGLVPMAALVLTILGLVLWGLGREPAAPAEAA